MSDSTDMQRALGRIEGAQGQILAELKRLGDSFSEHVQADQIAFSSVRNLSYSLRDELKKQFEAQGDARNQHLNEQDVKLDALKQDADRAKGAGWVILGLLASLATFVGGAVLAVVSGWLKIHI